MAKLRIAHNNSRTLHDFHGGIHPEENKTQSTQLDIQKASLPSTLIVPLQQHVGKSAKVLVNAGDRVLKGQLIADADGVISACVHAPSSGVVREISDQAIAHPSGLSAPCVVIDTDGEDQWCELEAHEDYLNLEREKVLKCIRRAGVAGMGGAGFPSEVKLHPANQKKLKTLVINGVECEPYITSDDMLMRTYADEMLRGIEIMARLLEPQHIVLAIEDNKAEAYTAIQEALAEHQGHTSASQYTIELAVIPTKYPSGGEKQLIYILTGEEVPSGGIPADIGVVCQNVATARAVYRAVRYGEPLISRITTLTGDQFKKSCNVESLIGTPMSHLLQEFQFQDSRDARLIIGGPMMGYTIEQLDTPVVKTTNCILAPSAKELPFEDQAQACIRCGLCTEACPAELLPQQLYWFSRSAEYEKAEQHNLFDCIECGACAYVCPSSIPLVQHYRHAKGEIKAKRLDTDKSEKARIRFEARQERLEREAQEKEAKRKARAEAAAKLQAEKKAAAANAESVDPKKAAIEAALARKNASKAETVSAQVSVEELQGNLDKAQSKLDKMIDALEDAKANAPDNVAKLQRAVEKNQLRVNQAKQALEKAQTVSAPTPQAVPEVSLETLQSNVDKAQAKLDKMIDTLEDAKANAPENVEKFQRAVDKNKARVEQAKQALNDAQAASSENKPEPKTETVPVEVLEANLEKAQAKLDKMIDTLEDAKANAPENIEKFQRAVDKNKVRVKAAQDALAQAKSQEVEN
ncbi:MAG: electron transport complex subunit RsxC [Oleiphilaceae bacterium]|nr:electron transport complex subunit RsxC [Oleiphilaceae bacterium]